MSSTLIKTFQRLYKKIQLILQESKTNLQEISQSLTTIQQLCERLDLLINNGEDATSVLGILTHFQGIPSALKSEHLRQLELLTSFCFLSLSELEDNSSKLGEICTTAFDTYEINAQVLNINDCLEASAATPSIATMLEWFDWLHRAQIEQQAHVTSVMDELKLFITQVTTGDNLQADDMDNMGNMGMAEKFSGWQAVLLASELNEKKVMMMEAIMTSRVPSFITL